MCPLPTRECHSRVPGRVHEWAGGAAEGVCDVRIRLGRQRGMRMEKGRGARAAAGQPLYIRAGRLSVPPFGGHLPGNSRTRKPVCCPMVLSWCVRVFVCALHSVSPQWSCVLPRWKILPHPRGTPGGKPQRLTARAKIARARLERFWPGEAIFELSVYRVCVCV